MNIYIYIYIYVMGNIEIYFVYSFIDTVISSVVITHI